MITVYITVLVICFIDGPANCSSMSVLPLCQAFSNAEDDSKTDISITLSTNGSPMCVVGYQIQFNGESKHVSMGSTADFTIIASEAQPFKNEIVVYTLDYENRTGQVPCTFSIAGEFPRIKQNISIWGR